LLQKCHEPVGKASAESIRRLAGATQRPIRLPQGYDEGMTSEIPNAEKNARHPRRFVDIARKQLI
jgi:hypothetical protein